MTNQRRTIPTKVTVQDISGEEDQYTLDRHGFQLVKHQSKEGTFDDEHRLKDGYYEECGELYKQMCDLLDLLVLASP